MPHPEKRGLFFKPINLFLATLCAVFLSEVVVMLTLSFLPKLSTIEEAILDSCLLSLLVVPILYHFFLKPFQRNIELRQQTELEHKRIQALDRMKSEFISIAAHELRTPLAAIMGYSELLLDKHAFGEAERSEFAEIIHKKTETMNRLISDLLDLNRIEHGHPLRIERFPQDIVATIEAQFDGYRQKHPSREFLVTLPPRPVKCEFDRVRIEQVLDNLLSNALKFSPPTAAIELEGQIRDGFLHIIVRDRGIGMTPEELNHVFDKFYRADSSDTAPSGLGLGMAITREIIVAHGGRIWLESAPEHGTTASFTLPLAPSV